MALVAGNGTYSNQNPGAASQTLAHTQDVGSDRLLLVVIAMQSSTTVTGMTYNGVAMTLIDKVTSGAYTKEVAAYYLLNPDTGNNNIVISFAGSQFNPTAIFARSFTGASGIGTSGWNDALATPNAQTMNVAANSIIFASGISGAAQDFGYEFGGTVATNVGNGFNINNIVEAAFSNNQPGGNVDVETIANISTITNYRVEIQEGGGGPGPGGSQGSWLMVL